jgi:hypothetical protein
MQTITYTEKAPANPREVLSGRNVRATKKAWKCVFHSESRRPLLQNDTPYHCSIHKETSRHSFRSHGSGKDFAQKQEHERTIAKCKACYIGPHQHHYGNPKIGTKTTHEDLWIRFMLIMKAKYVRPLIWDGSQPVQVCCVQPEE